MRTLTIHAFLIVFLVTSALVCVCLADLRVGAFNAETFGRSKVSDEDVLHILVQIVKRYGILLIQEIRDKSQTSIDKLVDAVNKDTRIPDCYNHTTSKRLGRNPSYQEQYSYVYRNDRVTLLDTYQYNDSSTNDIFHREPYCVKFRLRDAAVKELVLIGIHTDPDEAVEEMEALMDVHAAVEQLWNTDDILIMGDLNADCESASGRARESLTLRTDPRFTWLIDDDVDTTSSGTHCAFDRFIVSGEELRSSIVQHSSSVFRFDDEYKLDEEMTRRVSNHYPIELLIKSSPMTSPSPISRRPDDL